MSKKTYPEPASSEITPEAFYFNRRALLKMAGMTGLAALLTACGLPPGTDTPTPSAIPTIPKSINPTALPTITPTPSTSSSSTPSSQDELGNPATSFHDITHFNNYYEFSLGKEDVAQLTEKFKSSPWQIEVSGLVHRPVTFGMEDLLKKYPQEERIYRLRCVETWSMVIPWTGFPLAKLLKDVEPTGDAKYVKFTTAQLPDEMPGLGNSMFPWPYTEGLRLDEAMHDLTLLATGLYGQPLPNQDGAPIRLVAPWKYGFKSAKALVKIELVAAQPATFWNTFSPREYDFYANVDPNVPHPRWSQAFEQRIGETSRRNTLLLNGYASQVESLY